MDTRSVQSPPVGKPGILLDARTIAIIGASPDDARIGGKPMRFLDEFGFAGQVFPVHPSHREIRGHRCYPDLASIPGTIDVAVIAVPHQQAQAVVEQCVAKGVRQVIMFTSGYAETGPQGVARERALLQALAGGGTRLLGPNALGLANLETGMIANFGQGFELPPGVLRRGDVGFVSQSGAFGTFIFTLAAEHGIGFKYFAVTGNEADITISDLIAAMAEDPGIAMLAGYVEGIRDGRRFMQACEAARAGGKPVILIKTGRTAGGSAAALSHTAAIAGADEVYAAVFQQTGVLRVNDEEEMLDILALMRCERDIGGPRIAVLTMSGGAGVMLADAVDSHGLELAKLAPVTETALARIVPAFGSTRNPVDLTGQFLSDPDMLKGALECLLADPGVDAVVFFLGLGRRHGERIAQTLREVAATARKPLVVAWTAGPSAVIGELRESGVPVFSSPVRSIRALAALVGSVRGRGRERRSFALPPRRGAVELTTADAAGRCSEAASKAVLARYGICLPDESLVSTEDEAAAQAASIGYPVVLKVCAADLPHKTEAGAVALDVRDEAALRDAYRRILASARRYGPELHVEGVIVAAMVDDGVEMIVGGRRDPVFGPLIMVGFGGIYTELMQDVALRVLPLVPGESRELVHSLRGYPLLAGARGRPVADTGALAACIEAVAQILLEYPEVQELEINPLRVFDHGRGALALDALMHLRSSVQSSSAT